MQHPWLKERREHAARLDRLIKRVERKPVPKQLKQLRFDDEERKAA